VKTDGGFLRKASSGGHPEPSFIFCTWSDRVDLPWLAVKINGE